MERATFLQLGKKKIKQDTLINAVQVTTCVCIFFNSNFVKKKIQIKIKNLINAKEN